MTAKVLYVLVLILAIALYATDVVHFGPETFGMMVVGWFGGYFAVHGYGV